MPASCCAVGAHSAGSVTLSVFPPPHLQFFVASDPTVKTDRLWHDKYTLRTSMIPSFMTMGQCRKVGSCGSGPSARLPARGQGRSAVGRASWPRRVCVLEVECVLVGCTNVYLHVSVNSFSRS